MKPTDKEVQEFLRLRGMVGLLERGRDTYLGSLGDNATDAYIRRIVHEAAKSYGAGTERGAAFWEPALMRQAQKLDLFADPFTGVPSVAMSSSTSTAREKEVAMARLAKGCMLLRSKMRYPARFEPATFQAIVEHAAAHGLSFNRALTVSSVKPLGTRAGSSSGCGPRKSSSARLFFRTRPRNRVGAGPGILGGIAPARRWWHSGGAPVPGSAGCLQRSPARASLSRLAARPAPTSSHSRWKPRAAPSTRLSPAWPSSPGCTSPSPRS